MVSISPSDRDALRFIWLDDIHKDNPREVVYRFCRVVFGVTSSPFLLNATIKQHLQKYANGNPELVKPLLNSFYVDDMTSGESTVERGFDLFVNSRKIMAEGGFNLRKSQSNSPQLRCLMQGCDKLSEHEASHQVTRGSFREEDDTYTKTSIGMDNTAYSQCEQKVLRVNWNYLEDCLILPLKPLAQLACELPPTKRSILKVVAKIFDRLGVISPVTFQMKVLFQELCKQKINWDDPLPTRIKEDWASWCNELARIEHVKIPRCYTHGDQQDTVSYQLHGFCDSSLSGYAAVVYLRATSGASIQTAFVASKTRVAPLSQLTIPRLELLSALILSRLITTVEEALKPLVAIEKIYCWTDSTTALHWMIGTNKEWKMFVENRVKEIRLCVPPSSWNYCPGTENPADIPSRGTHASKRSESYLVIGRRLLTLPVVPLQIDDWDFGDHLTATKRSRYLADRIQHFRRRWQREYLVELREFHRPKGKNVTLPPVRINDVVILHDQGTSQRAFWKLARITDLIKGRGGKVRRARVLLAGKKTLIERSLQELFPLEVHASNTESTNQNSSTEDEPCGVIDGVSATQTRPRRTAAVVAEEKIKLIYHLFILLHSRF